MRIRSRSGVHRAAILLAAGALLTGCGASDSDPPAASDSAPSEPSTLASSAPGVPAAAAPRTKPWVDLQVGECVAAVPAVDVGEATVTIVDCSGPHQAEVYLLAPVAVNAAVADVADQACAAGVDEYTGGTAEPALSVTYLIDSNQDRTGAIPLPSTVICLLQAADGSALVQSVRG